MTTKSIGRKKLLKYAAISVVTILVLLTITILVFGQEPITFGRILETYKKELVKNINFVAIQTVLTLVTIWFVGGLIGQLIIEKGKNKFIIGGLSILTLWASVFVSSALTDGVMNSIKFGGPGFESAITMWTIYGLIPFLILGLLHGLIIGFPLGHEIKKSGEKLNS